VAIHKWFFAQALLYAQKITR